jgi:quercetin dioxygenase-like cupin family protein
MHIDHWDTARDGLLSERSMREKLVRLGYRVSRYVYPPGTYFPDHTHGVDKIDAVLSGRFRMIVEGSEVVLEAGDTIVVPRGTLHSAEVLGSNPVISLDATRLE